MADIYSIKGRIYKIFPTVEITDKFRKREFVIQTTNPTAKGTYIDYIKMQLVQFRCEMLDGLSKGDTCVVKFSLTGKKVGTKEEEKFFTNLDAIEIRAVGKIDTIKDSDNSAINDSLPMGDSFEQMNEENVDIAFGKEEDVKDLLF